jgi:hypothetical protein
MGPGLSSGFSFSPSDLFERLPDLLGAHFCTLLCPFFHCLELFLTQACHESYSRRRLRIAHRRASGFQPAAAHGNIENNLMVQYNHR